MLAFLEHETAEKARRAVIITAVLLISISKFLSADIDWIVGPLHFKVTKDAVLGGGFVMLLYFSVVFFARSYIFHFDFRQEVTAKIEDVRPWRSAPPTNDEEYDVGMEKKHKWMMHFERNTKAYKIKSMIFIIVDVFPPVLFAMFAVVSGASPLAAWRFIAS